MQYRLADMHEHEHGVKPAGDDVAVNIEGVRWAPLQERMGLGFRVSKP
jgi:hypothetical protein